MFGTQQQPRACSEPGQSWARSLHLTKSVFRGFNLLRAQYLHVHLAGQGEEAQPGPWHVVHRLSPSWCGGCWTGLEPEISAFFFFKVER